MAISLIAILFDFRYLIRSSSDLIEILNVGNELYTRLSQSTRQDLLMLTELPEVLSLKTLCRTACFAGVCYCYDKQSAQAGLVN